LMPTMAAPRKRSLSALRRRQLNAAVVDTFDDPAVRQRLMDEGHVIPPPEQLTPEALGAHHKAEIEKWWPMIKAAGIKIQ